MSIECNNTTPLGSRAGEELLDANSAALINAIIDLASLAEEDNPLSELDRNTVLDVTNGLNNILENTPLDGLNSLQAKLEENGGKLSPTDVAEFALNTNTDLTKIKEAVDDYNTNLPNSSSLTPAGTSTQAGQSGQFSDISGIVGQEGVVSDGSGTLPVETDEDLSISGICVNGYGSALFGGLVSAPVVVGGFSPRVIAGSYTVDRERLERDRAKKHEGKLTFSILRVAKCLAGQVTKREPSRFAARSKVIINGVAEFRLKNPHCNRAC